MQNGIFVNDADEVTVDGFMAQGYKSNGFFFTNLNGYTMNHLIAKQTGVYGLYAFNTIGGSMLNSEAYYVNDGAFYIGQTPPQDKPIRSIVRNVSGWGSPLGFSATNMRYVTITKCRFYNNALGIAPNALDSEKYPPAEDNVITDNDIFWNNFNYHQGKPPFTPRDSGTAALAPVGTGILLFGGKGNRIENNRIYGNFLAGVAAVEAILVTKTPEARTLANNVDPGQPVRPQRHRHQRRRHRLRRQRHQQRASPGRRDLDVPGRRLDLRRLRHSERFSKAVQDTMVGWIGEGAIEGLEEARPPAQGRLRAAGGLRLVKRLMVIGVALLVGAAPAQVSAPPRRRRSRSATTTTRPRSLTVSRGTTVTWKWPGFDEAGDVHDVKLKSGPKGVKKFQSEAASTDYSFKRKLTVPGTYKLVCTLHEEMTQTIKVRK